MQVHGPIPADGDSWPFGASIVDLGARGYLEEEYFFSGAAPRFSPVGDQGPDGHWSARRTSGGAFLTRAVVRRPRDAARFNGTVIIEWNNVSAGLEIFEQGDTNTVLDDGFAYVGVSAQRVGVHGFTENATGLRDWNPARYGELFISSDTLSYGIFAEVARAFAPSRARAPIDPLGGLEVRRLIGIGGSQSAARLVTYVNAIHPIEPLFDAFILFTWFGGGSTLEDDRVVVTSAERLAELAHHRTQVRDDLGVPVLVVNSECETLSCLPVRQPDSDRFRFWEVAGAPHGPRLHMELITAKLTRDGLKLPVPPAPEMFGPVPWAGVFDAALGHLQDWLTGGPPPPRQPPIDIDRSGAAPRIRRDRDGNACGGVRLPEHEVTLTRNIGALEESGAATLMGVCTPLPNEVLRRRYPDRAAYLTAFAAAAERAERAGVLGPVDARASMARAEQRRWTDLA